MDLSFLAPIGGPYVALAILAGILVLAALPSLLAKKDVKPKVDFRRCDACDWAGDVTALRPRCPRCNKPLT